MFNCCPWFPPSLLIHWELRCQFLTDPVSDDCWTAVMRTENIAQLVTVRASPVRVLVSVRVWLSCRVSHLLSTLQPRIAPAVKDWSYQILHKSVKAMYSWESWSEENVGLRVSLEQDVDRVEGEEWREEEQVRQDSQCQYDQVNSHYWDITHSGICHIDTMGIYLPLALLVLHR